MNEEIEHDSLFTDHFDLHDAQECYHECPWCRDEQQDHGGEG